MFINVFIKTLTVPLDVPLDVFLYMIIYDIRKLGYRSYFQEALVVPYIKFTTKIQAIQ